MNSLLLITAVMLPFGANAATTCSTALTADQAVGLQTKMFDAFGREDRRAWDRIVAPDLRAFERGKEYDRDAFFQLIVGAHRSGHDIRWSVTQPRVTSDCDLAEISYVNVGSVSSNGGPPTPIRWLETTTYRRTPDGWQMFLITSDRTADSPPAS